MSQVTLGGSLITLTPASSVAIDITINGVQYTEAWDTDVATTIANFMDSHSMNILNNYKYPVLPLDTGTTLELHGASLSGVSAASGTLADSNEGIRIPVSEIVSHNVSSSTVVVNIDTANTAADVVTITCLNPAHAEEVNNRLSVILQKKGGSVNAVSAAIA